MILAVSTLGIVLIVLAALVVLLFAGGLIANARRQRAEKARLRAQIDAANAALADAHAADKGWERTTLEQAARRVFAERHGDVPVTRLHLVQVVDRPGVEADLAVFHVHGAGRVETITLGRSGDAWVAAERV